MAFASLLLCLLLFVALPLLLLLIFRRPNSNLKLRPLPPGPGAVPLIGNIFVVVPGAFRDLELLLRRLHAHHGPIISLRIGTVLHVFISDRHLAHQALVDAGAALADRHGALIGIRERPNTINSNNYGALWRLLRRNLVAEMLHPSRVKLFAPARVWVLRALASDLAAAQVAASAGAVEVVPAIQHAMFRLLVAMCFGERLGEDAVREIGKVQRELVVHINKMGVFAFVPALTKRLFKKRLDTAAAIRRRQESIYVPLIRARAQQRLKGEAGDSETRLPHSYVDTLLDLTVPEEDGSRRPLTETDTVALCSEFLNAGTDTTATALQWILAELVKNQDVQEKLWNEIKATAGAHGDEELIPEEELQRMPYLKAVVLEGLRLHPPGHFVLPHAPAEDVEVGGYRIPKGARVNFLVAEIGRDPASWDRPTEFWPERFMEGGEGADVDITGSREIRMMPFGVGRRICAGMGVAMLHLEYFVANLVRAFEWKAAEGEELDMAEKAVFTVVMAKPLRARLVPRRDN